MRSLKINKIRDRPAQNTLNVSRVETALADPRRVETRRYVHRVSCSARKGGRRRWNLACLCVIHYGAYVPVQGAGLKWIKVKGRKHDLIERHQGN